MNLTFALVCFVLLILSLLLSFVRLLRGPTLFDRILASESITITMTCCLIVIAIFTKSSFYIDILLLFSLLGFITPTAFIDFMIHKKDSYDQ